jgi:hypothetical protein
MTFDGALARLLFALALFAFAASAQALLARKTPRLLSKLPPSTRKLWVFGALLVAAGCVMRDA